MGYICSHCGEGLPDDTSCPCTMGGDDEDEGGRVVIGGPLTAEVAAIDSPVRGFLNDRFTFGLRDIQRRYREAAPPLAIAPAPAADANPGSLGTAADWLLRFLLHPQPNMRLAVLGVRQCARAGIELRAALSEISESLGMAPHLPPEQRNLTFAGPQRGSAVDPAHLARCCWALALLTESWRRGPRAAAAGPLGRFRGNPSVRGDDLVGLAPPAGLDQLTKFRYVFESALIPEVATRHGLWTLGPTFVGSQLINADADLVADGLLLDLKTSAKKPSLAVTEVFQVIGYVLLDFDDEHRIDTVGIFSARYAYLATWQLDVLLDDLAGHQVDLELARDQFRRMLSSHQSPVR